MTVFMIPPRNVSVEVEHQLLRCREGIVNLLLADVPVVTFASFVVVPQHAFATDHIGKPVLERMLRRWDRFRDSPHGNLCERVGRKDNAATH
jgi:hypothetical protein